MKYPDVSNLDFPLLEPDSYIVKLDEIKTEKRDGSPLLDNNKRPYIILIWKVKGHDGVTVSDLPIYPDADPKDAADFGRLKRIQEIVSALGGPLAGGEFYDLVGKTCRAAVITNTYKGKENNKIAHYEPIESGSESFSENKKDDDLPF